MAAAEEATTEVEVAEMATATTEIAKMMATSKQAPTEADPTVEIEVIATMIETDAIVHLDRVIIAPSTTMTKGTLEVEAAEEAEEEPLVEEACLMVSKPGSNHYPD